MILRSLLLVATLSESVIGGIPGTSVDEGTSRIQKQLEGEAQNYLKAFGYQSLSKSGETEFRKALVNFQESFLMWPSGYIDIPTLSKMNEVRCANADVYQGGPVPAVGVKDLWKKKTISWAVDSLPAALPKAEVVEAAHAAFAKWKTAVDFDFEMAKDVKTADIQIVFDTPPTTSLKVAASATKPGKSKIILDKNAEWAHRQEMPTGLSLFYTLLHEIGHCLGLPHNFYRGSIMFPILKPAVKPTSTLTSISAVDRIAVRRLYGLTDLETNSVDDHFQQVKCPKFADSVVALSKEHWLLFRKNKVWRIQDKRYIDAGQPIARLFPEGPQFVNATAFCNNLVLLFVDRTIYGYEFDGISFTRAADYPKELHDRVLFYPQGAFPLNNGSVILLSGDVFATYNVARNQPSFLNDKNRYFPNLPTDLKSGIQKNFGSDQEYWMFDEATVSDYDMHSKQILQLKNIPEFIRCN